MLDQIHLLAAVTVLGVLEQGREHRIPVPKYLLGQSTVPPPISLHFHAMLLLSHCHSAAFQSLVHNVA